MIYGYIGPGLGVGAIVLLIVIGGLIIFSFGYLLWYKLKNRKSNTK